MDELKDQHGASEKPTVSGDEGTGGAINSEECPACSGEIDMEKLRENLDAVLEPGGARVLLDDPDVREGSQEATVEYYEQKLVFERATTLKKIRVLRSDDNSQVNDAVPQTLMDDPQGAMCVPQTPMYVPQSQMGVPQTLMDDPQGAIAAPEGDLFDDFSGGDTPVDPEDSEMYDEVAAEVAPKIDGHNKPKTSEVNITAAGEITTEVQRRVLARTTLSGTRFPRKVRATGLSHEEEED